MYSATLGRFLQRDPAGYVGGLNLYAYVMNNPLRYLDPEGLTSLEKRTDSSVTTSKDQALQGFGLLGGVDVGVEKVYIQNNSANTIDAEELVLFFGISGGLFISDSPSPESRTGYAITGSYGIAYDTASRQFSFYQNQGKADRAKDVVAGIGAGCGFTGGLLKGNMSDFYGVSTERTEHFVILSTTKIETASGKGGFVLSAGGKAFGLGYTTMDILTSPLGKKLEYESGTMWP
jgi:uncharacterized protein RhaS with RHS repeats